jgi:6-phosphogluconolactonase (cycloisomerase 2 family)
VTEAPAVAVEARGRFLYIGSGNPSAIVGYSIDPATGALTPIPGSPFAISSSVGVQALVSDGAGKFLYAGGSGISVLAIDPTTGALTQIPGSPFGILSNAYGLAMDPQNRFLFVSGTSGLTSYAINGTTGALTALAGSPFYNGGIAAGVSFDGSGKFLYAAQSGTTALFGFAVNTTSGNLTMVPGDPFVCGSGANAYCYGPVGDASGKYVYAAAGSLLQGYQIDGVTGALTPINGVSPFPSRFTLVQAPGSAAATLAAESVGGCGFTSAVHRDRNLQRWDATVPDQFSKLVFVQPGRGDDQQCAGTKRGSHNYKFWEHNHYCDIAGSDREDLLNRAVSRYRIAVTESPNLVGLQQ